MVVDHYRRATLFTSCCAAIMDERRTSDERRTLINIWDHASRMMNGLAKLCEMNLNLLAKKDELCSCICEI